MHLKTLTMKGFKSFASATTLRLEPGVTCVVGPNGSGKSNVVDAIAWVLGEQGVKSLRGGKMEDVIFAGSASSGTGQGRAPLGRAEVTLTIDNTDGELPIDYSEVSITRRMFAGGASEYEINGASCRLLDIQELLSDSGIGREMHVIVGQGQLDAVLQARPEDRRGFIEEAAGVLKHRKRKEKAVRKLEAMAANLTRLTDLTAELRRQLKPLGRQAEIARRAAMIQAELRDSKLRLLADDLVGRQAALEREIADETALRERRTAVEARLGRARARLAELEAALAGDLPRLEAAQRTWFELSALRERFEGTARLAVERGRHLAAPVDDDRLGREPEELERDAEAMRVQELGKRTRLAADRERLGVAVGARAAAEDRLAGAEAELAAATRAVADRRESLAALAGNVDALRSRTVAAGEEVERLASAAADARSRAEQTRAEFEATERQVGALDESELGLDERYETAVSRFEQARSAVQALRDAERDAERERSSWRARHDALQLGLRRKDGAAALLAAGDRLPGMLGPIAALLHVQPGYEAAIAAALGGLADAVAVAGVDDAAAALRILKSGDGGRADLAIGDGSRGSGSRRTDSPCPAGSWPGAGMRRGEPPTGTWAADLVTAPAALVPAIAQALRGVLVVGDLDAARQAVAADRTLIAVTVEGDLLGSTRAAGGSASAPSRIEIQAAVEEAAERLAAGSADAARIAGALQDAVATAAGASAHVDTALEQLHDSDARMSAAAGQLAELGAATRSAAAEAERLEGAQAKAAAARESDLAALLAAENRLAAARSAPVDLQPSTTDRDDAAGAVALARQAEVDARLAVRTAEERERATAGAADRLVTAAREERARRDRQRSAREARARGATVADGVRRGAELVLARIAESLQSADAARQEAAAARGGRETELVAVRRETAGLAEEMERLTDTVHRDEMARAEQRLRIEGLAERAFEEFGIDPDTLASDYGPQVPMPPGAADIAEFELARERGEQVSAPTAAPYDRSVCAKRAAKAEREHTQLGKVNPLALEEFAACEERHAFLAEQLADLKATRRDLLTVIGEVDERIHGVFAAAFADTAKEFKVVFGTLFPGGDGRLVLTDPDDMLATGIEVEARPPGKKVKRLSLLSGGERSLVAVALLVAIFRARPSPFYVLDEIEAALDDTNLGRLIDLLEELRSTSQLIVITHQKRTMEVADALYGVSMRGDGITTVISQRLRELATA